MREEFVLNELLKERVVLVVSVNKFIVDNMFNANFSKAVEMLDKVNKKIKKYEEKIREKRVIRSGK